MAKSKAGGTRSYLRGRIASDVYSIGKDGKGKKQQVVRGLAESVANPRTEAQMRQRMIMATVSELAKGLRKVVNHSFDDIAVGQASVSEFSRLAIAAYNEDAAKATPLMGYLPYGVATYPSGVVQVSQGKVIDHAKVYCNNRNTYAVAVQSVSFALVDTKHLSDETDESAPSVKEFVDECFGGNRENYRTFIMLAAGKMKSVADMELGDILPKAFYVRLRIKPSIADDTSLMTLTKADFDIESNFDVKIDVKAGSYAPENGGQWLDIYKDLDADNLLFGSCWATILSSKVNRKWKHSTSYLSNVFATGSDDGFITVTTETVKAVEEFAAALATYPTGTDKFLNGGDL